MYVSGGSHGFDHRAEQACPWLGPQARYGVVGKVQVKEDLRVLPQGRLCTLLGERRDAGYPPTPKSSPTRTPWRVCAHSCMKVSTQTVSLSPRRERHEQKKTSRAADRPTSLPNTKTRSRRTRHVKLCLQTTFSECYSPNSMLLPALCAICLRTSQWPDKGTEISPFVS
jgi:hypothetical protein